MRDRIEDSEIGRSIGAEKTIQLIRDYAASERIPYSHILIDEDGVGGGVVDQLSGVKGFVAASSPVPTRTMIRRQMLPTANLSIEGKQQIAAFQHLKAQCAFKLAELVETHRLNNAYLRRRRRK